MPGDLHNSQQVKDDEDDDNNDENMDPIPGAREARADVPAKKADQPQNEQNNDDSPNHGVSPFLINSVRRNLM